MKRMRVLDCGDSIRVCVYTVGTRWDSDACRKVRKDWRRNAMKRINMRNCQEALDAKIHLNFKPSDWHVVFTLSAQYETDDYRQLKKYWQAFTARLRRARKRRGAPAPTYAYVLEGCHGDKRLHIHALFAQVDGDIQEFNDLWRYGNAEIIRIEDVEHRDTMGSYLTKEPRMLGRPHVGSRAFSTSLNCITPHPVSYRVDNSFVYAPPDGYRVVHSEQVNNEFGSFAYFVCKACNPIHI